MIVSLGTKSEFLYRPDFPTQTTALPMVDNETQLVGWALLQDRTWVFESVNAEVVPFLRAIAPLKLIMIWSLFASVERFKSGIDINGAASPNIEFKRCTWKRSDVLKGLCSNSMYLRMVFDKTGGYTFLWACLTGHDDAVPITEAEIAEKLAKGCGSGSLGRKFESVFFSFQYYTKGGEPKGHANVLFVTETGMERFDPNSVSRSDNPVDEALIRIAGMAGIRYEPVKLNIPDVEAARGVSVQRRSGKFREKRANGTCATWTVLVAMLKSQNPRMPLREIEMLLGRLSGRALYCLVMALGDHLLAQCASPLV